MPEEGVPPFPRTPLHPLVGIFDFTLPATVCTLLHQGQAMGSYNPHIILRDNALLVSFPRRSSQRQRA